MKTVTPTQKDLAESFAIALLNNAVNVTSVVRWADRLLPQVSDELRKLAAHRMSQEGPG